MSSSSMSSLQSDLSSESFIKRVESAFPGLTIDKRRLPESKLQSRGVPAYVGEWLLDRIIPGYGNIQPTEQEKIATWSGKFIPKANDQQIIKHRLSVGESVKVLTPVQVEVRLRKKDNVWEKRAQMPLLGLEGVLISDQLLETYPDLLRQGMWGVVELAHFDEGTVLVSFNPMQAIVDLQLFKQARSTFSFLEWRHILLVSMGYAPEAFTEDEQTLLLCRLLPLVQKSMHQVELAPKATGKSYLYENISPQIRLVSGGNVTPAVLFVNNSSGQWGLLARFKAVVLDEIQTLDFSAPEEIVGGLKGFLANGQLTRGGLYQTASDCSFLMLANIRLDQQQNPIYRNFMLEELPAFLHETAFLDRLKGIVPGWKLPKLSPKAYANTVGLKADFFGDALIALRDDLSFDQHVARKIQWLGDGQYARNTNSVLAIASGLMKLQFTDGNVSDADLERYCLRPAMEMRQLVWDQLQLLDSEYRQYRPTLSYRIV